MYTKFTTLTSGLNFLIKFYVDDLLIIETIFTNFCEKNHLFKPRTSRYLMKVVMEGSQVYHTVPIPNNG